MPVNTRNLPINYRPGYDDWDEEWSASLRGQHLGVFGLSLAAQLHGLVAGDSRELLVFPIVPQLRSGATRTVSKAYFTLKDKDADSDPTENAAFSADGGRLGVTTSDVTGVGQIISASTPEIRFDLTAANTALLTARRAYFFDCQIVMSDGAIYTVEQGIAELQKQITVATS